MGMDSAVREFVEQIREIVADEVRAQMASQVSVASMGHSGAIASPQENTTGAAVSTVPATGQATVARPVTPHAPADLAQPNFDAAEAAWFLRYTTIKSFYQAVRRYGIPHARRGHRVMLFTRADLEKFLASRSRGR